MNLDMGIVHLNADTIAGDVPEHPVSSMNAPALVLNLIAYLVTGYA